MEEIKKEFNKDDYRFSFNLDINDGVNNNTNCKKYFNINNFDEDSLKSVELKECVDDIVTMIDMDLKSKTRTYLWYNIEQEVSVNDNGCRSLRVVHQNDYDENHSRNYELDAKAPESQVTTLKFTFFDGETPIISKAWSGDVYPPQVRNNIDLTNKKYKYESVNIQALDFQRQIAQKAALDKGDLTNSIRNLICSVCASFPQQNNRKVIYKQYLPELGYETMAVRKNECIAVKNRLQASSVQMGDRNNSAIFDVYTNELKFGDVVYDLTLKQKNKKQDGDRVLTQNEIREKLKMVK